MYKNISTQKGFSLIEMIVSLAVFTVVALIAIGALLKIMDANRKSINLKNTINNLNFTLESMSREMRVGKKFYLTNSISSINPASYDPGPEGNSVTTSSGADTWTISFLSSKKSNVGSAAPCNLIYAYRIQENILKKAQQVDCNNAIITDTDFRDLTSSNITITNSSIVLSPDAYRLISMSLKGYSMVKDKDRTDFTIQTSVSQRVK